MPVNYYTDTSEDTLDAAELELYNLIMGYRAELGLASIPLSPSLTATAGRHALDTIHNVGRYAGHSWSDAPYDGNDRSTYDNMWSAPERVGTLYTGNGYEITSGYTRGGDIAASTITPERALESWKNSPPHNAVMTNQDVWTTEWKAIGVGIHAGIAHVWFGHEVDPDTTFPGEVAWNTDTASVEVTAATYQFFTGKAPEKTGFAFLISSPNNPSDLNDPFYGQFNIENRYINFANNLGSLGEGKDAFAATYGSLSFEETIARAYDTIVGRSEAQAAGVDPDAAIAFFTASYDYYAAVANERGIPSGVSLDQAVKVVAVGSILNEAMKSDVGRYADAVNAFAADVRPDAESTAFGQDLFAVA